MLLEGKYKLLSGQEVDLKDFQGSVVLVVNTASHCGFTPQYQVLEDLWQKYRDQGLVILGFPSGSFADQEFLDGGDILDFCQKNYGVTFPLFEKSDVLKENDLFQKLAQVSEAPEWNFTKYLVGRDGALLTRLAPGDDEGNLFKAIKEAL